MTLEPLRTYRAALSLVGRRMTSVLVTILVLSLLAAAMEVVGLTLVLVILSTIVLEGENSLGSISTNFVLEALKGVPLMHLLPAMAGAYLCKCALMLWIRWIVAKGVILNEAQFGIDVFRLFIESSMLRLGRYNTGHIEQKVKVFTGTVFSGVILAGLNIVSQGVLAAAVIVLLLLIDVKITLGAIVLMAILGPVFVRLTHRATRHIGLLTTDLAKAYSQTLLESIHGLKAIKVTDSEEFFIDKFSKSQMDYAHARVLKTFIQQSTGIYLESFAVVALVVLFGIMISLYGPSESLVILGTFTAAVSRLMGYVNQMLINLNQIAFGDAAVNDLLKDFRNLREADSKTKTVKAESTLQFEDLVELRDVTFGYVKGARPEVSGLSLAIPRNTAIAIVGQSGAGKSTLVDLLAGILEPDSGEILCDGRPVRDHVAAWKAQIGYVPQTFYMFDDTIRRNIAIGTADDEIDDVRVLEALKRAHLAEFIAQQPEGLDTVIGDRGGMISGGQGQRLAIARALYRRPKLLILDEATSALDPPTESLFMSEVLGLRSSMAIVFVTHRIAAAEQCDEIYELKHGKLTSTKDTSGRHPSMHESAKRGL